MSFTIKCGTLYHYDVSSDNGVISQSVKSRWVVLFSSKNKMGAKSLCIYKNEESKKPIKQIVIDDWFEAHEYYGDRNTDRDNLHFIVNNDTRCIFKCGSLKEKLQWICAIIDTTLEDAIPAYATMTESSILSSEDTRISLKWRCIFVSNNFDNDYKLKEHDYFTDGGFSIPVSISFQKCNSLDSINYCKFVLIIEKARSATICDLIYILETMVTNYIAPKKTDSHGISVYFNKNGLEILDDGFGTSLKRFLSTMDIHKYGITVMCQVSPFTANLSMKNQRSDDSNETKNDKNDKDDSKDNGDSNGSSEQEATRNQVCDQGMKCPIYLAMKSKYEYTKSNYKHMSELNHFYHDINNKPICRYGDNCKAFLRLARINENENDYDCYRFDDRCHLLIYRHPPRADRQSKLYSNMNKLIMQTDREKITEVKMDDIIIVNDSNNNNNNNKDNNNKYDRLHGLIDEVIKNGYEKDLCLTSQDYVYKHHTIMKIVNEKLECGRHKYDLLYPLLRDEMLALILYTGCECNYDLCKSQREGDYSKWKHFDKSLYSAINKINLCENYQTNTKLYSGLQNVQLTQKKLLLSYFPTYLSTSYIREVSLGFCQSNGMLMELNENIIAKFVCCSVEWISKFHDETEILIARTDQKYSQNSVTMTIIDSQLKVKKIANSTKLFDVKNMQIVKISSFDENEHGIKLYDVKKMQYFNQVFDYICNHCVIPPKLANDAAFKKYAKKLPLKTSEIVDMQQESHLMRIFCRVFETSLRRLENNLRIQTLSVHLLQSFQNV